MTFCTTEFILKTRDKNLHFTIPPTITRMVLETIIKTFLVPVFSKCLLPFQGRKQDFFQGGVRNLLKLSMWGGG